MTVQATVRKVGPTLGNALATVFPFAFKVFAATDILVTLTTIATGQAATLVLNDPLGYTVALNADQNANPGGSITYNPLGVPLPATQTLTISSIVPEVQGTHIINGGAFFANNVEDAVDKAVINVQDLAVKVAASLQYPVGDPALGATLPTAALRASKNLAFDAAGNVIATAASGAAVPVETLVQVLDTIALLKALAVPAAAVTYLVRGFGALGDGGGGFYYWKAGDVTADDGGRVLQLNVGGAGRFNKLF